MTTADTSERIRQARRHGRCLERIGPNGKEVPVPRQRQIDVTIGEVRVVIGSTGLVGLYRNRGDEHITLVPGEAVAIARVLLKRFGSLTEATP